MRNELIGDSYYTTDDSGRIVPRADAVTAEDERGPDATVEQLTVRRQRAVALQLDVADATVEQHGSLILVREHTDAARDWIRDNVQDGALYLGGSLVVEPRYVEALVAGMIAAGLVIA